MSDANILGTMKMPLPAAVLAGGESKRMGLPKASLPYGGGTLLEFQTRRLSRLFEEVLVAVKRPPEFAVGPGRLLLDGEQEAAAIHGLLRVLEEVSDRVFVLAVDLPAVGEELISAIAQRGLSSGSAALLPEEAGVVQPLAGVWRRSVLPAARERVARGDLSLQGLAGEVGAEIFPEREWRAFDRTGNAFANLNTLQDYAAMRERA
jgi:molybdopterin-guanine dinucleotide biosynthesis protein A